MWQWHIITHKYLEKILKNLSTASIHNMQQIITNKDVPLKWHYNNLKQGILWYAPLALTAQLLLYFHR